MLWEDFLTGVVAAALEARGDRLPGGGGGAGDRALDQIKAAQRHTRRDQADKAEEAVLNQVPCRAVGWTMTGSDFKPKDIAALRLERRFPDASESCSSDPSASTGRGAAVGKAC